MWLCHHRLFLYYLPEERITLSSACHCLWAWTGNQSFLSVWLWYYFKVVVTQSSSQCSYQRPLLALAFPWYGAHELASWAQRFNRQLGAGSLHYAYEAKVDSRTGRLLGSSEWLHFRCDRGNDVNRDHGLLVSATPCCIHVVILRVSILQYSIVGCMCTYLSTLQLSTSTMHVAALQVCACRVLFYYNCSLLWLY